MNIAAWLDRAALRWPDRPALMRGMSMEADYAAFRARAAALGEWLRQHGIGPGDRVAIFMRNCPEYLIVLFGCWYAGAIAVPINARLHPREASWIIANSGARLCFTTPGLDAGIEGAECVDPTMADLLTSRASATGAAPSLPPDTIAWLFYTSGTTGRPKGVCITHGMLIAMSLTYTVDVDSVLAEDAAYYAAPMSHGSGLYSPVHVLHGAAHLCPVSGGFDPAELLETAAAHRSLSMFMAPTMVHRLTVYARSHGRTGAGIRTIVYGGGPMYRADIEAALDVFGPKFVQIYGQGECPMAITALPRLVIAERAHPDWAGRIDSVGQAQSAVEVQVSDEQGRPVPTGETGEITVRGLPVMPGYWRNPEATARTLRDGWLLTGDVGSMDENGFVTLKDRSKDVIISAGVNIYPREVEEALLSHPGVAEACVLGRVSAVRGEDVVAYVVPTPEATLSKALLSRHCVERIARFKRPRHYRFVCSLPKNAYGKVLKTELRNREIDVE